MAPNTGGKPIDTWQLRYQKILVRMKTLSLLLKVKQLNSLVLFWLVVDKSGKLQVTSTQNQDNPLMKTLLFQELPFWLWIYGTCLLSWLSIPKKNYIDSFSM
jgi:Fe-Mn family superoxide dismutase